MFWKALVNYGEYVAILQLGAIDFFHPIVKIEKPHEFTEGYIFSSYMSIFFGGKKKLLKFEEL